MNGDLNQPPPADVDAMIARLEGQRAAIDNAIQALQALQGAFVSAVENATPASTVSVAIGGDRAITPEQVDSTTFFGARSLREAARKYLDLVKRKQTTTQIVEALERGGYPHSSKKLYYSLYTVLQRDPEIMRIGSEWALRAWFPGHARRSEESAKPRKPKKAKRAKMPKAPNPRSDAKAAKSPPPPPNPEPLRRIRLAKEPAEASTG